MGAMAQDAIDVKQNVQLTGPPGQSPPGESFKVYDPDLYDASHVADALELQITPGMFEGSERGQLARLIQEKQSKGGGSISVSSILSMLNTQFGVSRKLGELGNLFSNPVKTAISTIRHYSLGNDFQQAVGFLGEPPVKFLMAKYWKPIIQALKPLLSLDTKAISKAGLINRVQVSEPRSTVFDYGPGQKQAGNFGCSQIHSVCWMYAPSSIGMSAGASCVVQNPYQNDAPIFCDEQHKGKTGPVEAKSCFDQMKGPERTELRSGAFTCLEGTTFGGFGTTIDKRYAEWEQKHTAEYRLCNGANQCKIK